MGDIASLAQSLALQAEALCSDKHLPPEGLTDIDSAVATAAALRSWQQRREQWGCERAPHAEPERCGPERLASPLPADEELERRLIQELAAGLGAKAAAEVALAAMSVKDRMVALLVGRVTDLAQDATQPEATGGTTGPALDSERQKPSVAAGAAGEALTRSRPQAMAAAFSAGAFRDFAAIASRDARARRGHCGHARSRRGSSSVRVQSEPRAFRASGRKDFGPLSAHG